MLKGLCDINFFLKIISLFENAGLENPSFICLPAGRSISGTQRAVLNLINSMLLLLAKMTIG
ncbi:MAG: hypothetical protein A2042_06190 [Candidatus Schekmanbacteria bacterium GWA2_38_11]|uniref:Uncharacterized protein n=1 Tax=Candidatus Schekmanbacteria bacterium GWA2_38_11 TaxID=1817876 RepID=A0A1F7RA74_9BACT|nr:MAG: hypothetical protein A2042_06190 [Candidatus Schekmanbacteria bacterium GWA2_38_11]